MREGIVLFFKCRERKIILFILVFKFPRLSLLSLSISEIGVCPSCLGVGGGVSLMSLSSVLCKLEGPTCMRDGGNYSFRCFLSHITSLFY